MSSAHQLQHVTGGGASQAVGGHVDVRRCERRGVAVLEHKVRAREGGNVVFAQVDILQVRRGPHGLGQRHNLVGSGV